MIILSGLDKTADLPSLENNKDGYAATGVGAAALGGGGYMLDPRETYYHGTSESNAESIKNDGFNTEMNHRNAFDEVNRSWFASPGNIDIAQSHAEGSWAHEKAENSDSSVEELRRSSSGGKGEVMKTRLPVFEMDYITTDHRGTGHSIGTPDYVGPEHIKGSGSYKPVDINEVGRYVKQTPSGKAGLGLALGGVGALGYGLQQSTSQARR